MTKQAPAPPRRCRGVFIKSPRILAAAAVFMSAAAAVCGRNISPLLAGNNLWYASRSSPSTSPSTTVMNLAGTAGIRLIRIGGIDFDQNMPSDQTLLTWINRIRAIGAEPVIQISQFRSAAQAAATVRFINITSGANVRYWSIGNEPWLQARKNQTPAPTEAEIAAAIEGYFKPLAAAMKEADPAIRIFGVDSEDFQSGLHARLFGGSNNIAGKVPGKSYYYCDGLSWHRYPQEDNIDPAWQGLADIRGRIEKCRALVDAVNQSEGRAGGDALLWAIGEFNSKNGAAVHTWGNGQMFAGVFGLAMKHGAEFAAPWSLYESEGKRTSTDFGLLDGATPVPRPSYWHTKFTADHFSGNYLEGTPSVSSASSDILVYGAENPGRGQISVMILNRGQEDRPYTLHLNKDAAFAAAGAIALNVDASRAASHNDTIPRRSTHVLVFRRDSFTRTVYTDDDFTAGRPPQTAVSPRSPLGGVLDDFESYNEFSTQGYWKPLPVGGGAASVNDGVLVLRAADTPYASAAAASPVASDYNFFQRGYAITLDGFAQTRAGIAAHQCQFRLCLNSSQNRSYGADDSLVLRVDPQGARLGFKLNQPGVHGELRAGTATAQSSLLEAACPSPPRTIRLSLEPLATTAGLTTVFYQIQLDGVFGRIVRRGTFEALAAEWGGGGDSSLVIESRRDSDTAGGGGSYAEASIATVSVQGLMLDDFETDGGFSSQNYWLPLTVGVSSTTEVSGGAALLTARSQAFASAAIAGSPVPELNFFRHGFTLDIRNIALTPANLPADQAYFRISLCSTPQRPYTSPDALTLRLSPESVRLGFKLDQPSTDAELRTGTGGEDSFLIHAASPGQATAVRLTLIPAGTPGPATPVFYALRIASALGDTIHTGTFTADYPRWGAAGDSSLVLEARRASPSNGDSASYMQASVGSVHYAPVPDDLFENSPHFASWRLSQFTLEELAQPEVSGPQAAPAGDGVCNLVKYAFGLDARLPVSADLLPILFSSGGDGPRFVHAERFGATDISYDVEASTDLVDWSVPVEEPLRSSANGGWITVTSAAMLPAETPAAFYRVKVTSPPD